MPLAWLAWEGSAARIVARGFIRGGWLGDDKGPCQGEDEDGAIRLISFRCCSRQTNEIHKTTTNTIAKKDF